MKKKKELFRKYTFGEKFRTKNNKPALLISSTSWTKDENFQLLLDALTILDEKISNINYTEIVMVITGKGDTRDYYEEVINDLNQKFNKITIYTDFLSLEDYVVLLGSADLGISLHYSSSGLDLPMKVVDMFGCELPVCAIYYQCLNELVIDDENGMIFRDKEELSDQLYDTFLNFPKDLPNGKLKRFSDHITQNFKSHSWETNWTNVALPIFEGI